MDSADENRPATISLKNILFAMDFSPISLRAFPFAVGIASHYGAKILVVHVVSADDYEATPLGERDLLDRLLNAAMEAGLNDPEGLLRNVHHEMLVDHGDISARLLASEGLCDIDLAVIGTHGWQGMRKLLKGSTAEKIAFLAATPVLIVGPKATRPPEFRLILYAPEQRPTRLHGLSYVVSLAQTYGARLVLLHVNYWDGQESPADAVIKTPEFLHQQLAKYGTSEVAQRADVMVDFGPRADCILEHAKLREADLIVHGPASPGHR